MVSAYSVEDVAAVAAWSPSQVSDCLGRARGGCAKSLADFVAHSLLRQYKQMGADDKDAIAATAETIAKVNIELRYK